MEVLKGYEIVNATKGIVVRGDNATEFSGVSTDSRKINKGDLFIPIKGDNFDGHDFIHNAIEAGAAGYITHKDITTSEPIAAIKVKDTLEAMQNIALYYRNKFNVKMVAVTGSVGKTSTKDMIASVLGQKYNVLSTAGNFNNQIGLPLTLFNIDKTHEVVVTEMGMNSLGEIETLSKIACPDIAIITNIGIAHIEKLGSRQNILKAKMEIVQGLKPDGVLILNGDDALLSGLKNFVKVKVKYYGTEQDADVHAGNIRIESEEVLRFDVLTKSGEHTFSLPAPGRHNVYNALSAIAVGLELDVEPEDIKNGLKCYTQANMRMNIYSTDNGIKIIDDTYNANPQSMEAAINVLSEMKNYSRKIAVLGDMLELGNWSNNAHRGIGRLLTLKGIDYIITLGENARNIANGAVEAGISEDNVVMFDDAEDINTFLGNFIKNGDIILVKGSRAMKMERIVEFIKNI